VDVQVVALGAWCDNVTDDGRWFRVQEFASLSDGRRLTLSDDRGWGSTSSQGPSYDAWTDLTVENVERDVRNVVLPDDAEETGDEHPWDLLAERLNVLGVEATPEQLRRIPYEVILSRRLQERLSPAGEAPAR